MLGCSSGTREPRVTRPSPFLLQNLFRRVAFGKSSIHGWGAFARVDFLPGDMVSEYQGELLRPSISVRFGSYPQPCLAAAVASIDGLGRDQLQDLREKAIYNDKVGAGTYVFALDDRFNVDATLAGNITHMLNHSCEPNCYSRLVEVDGVCHVIIFAGKSGVRRGEELTYNYRFGGAEDRLKCNCGAPGCRGTVNVIQDPALGYVPEGPIQMSRKQLRELTLAAGKGAADAAEASEDDGDA